MHTRRASPDAHRCSSLRFSFWVPSVRGNGRVTSPNPEGTYKALEQYGVVVGADGVIDRAGRSAEPGTASHSPGGLRLHDSYETYFPTYLRTRAGAAKLCSAARSSGETHHIPRSCRCTS